MEINSVASATPVYNLRVDSTQKTKNAPHGASFAYCQIKW